MAKTWDQVVVNGQRRTICNFKEDKDVYYGYINGKFCYVLKKNVENYCVRSTEKSNALRALVHAYDKEYGKPDKRDVKNAHIENLGNGVSRGTAKVDGEEVEVLYTGTCTNSLGDVVNAKPWLGDFRKDAAKAKDCKKKTYAFAAYDTVDNEFIYRLINEKNLRVFDGVVSIGSKEICIKGMMKLEAAKAIEAAIIEYKAEKAKLEEELNAIFMRIA